MKNLLCSKLSKNILLFSLIFSLLSCKKNRELPTVTTLDIGSYLGTWYEIARLPNSFEKGLECVTATYTMKENGKIEVLNKGHVIGENSKVKTAKGEAIMPNTFEPGQLKVTFFWPFYGDYYIIELDENYTYALVGDPSRKYLWILSRTPQLDQKTYKQLLNSAGKHGFDTTTIINVYQSCNEE